MRFIKLVSLNGSDVFYMNPNAIFSFRFASSERFYDNSLDLIVTFSSGLEKRIRGVDIDYLKKQLRELGYLEEERGIVAFEREEEETEEIIKVLFEALKKYYKKRRKK